MLQGMPELNNVHVALLLHNWFGIASITTLVTSRNIAGNLVDATVSDEKLKADIKDFDEEQCVTNVKIKTRKYKAESKVEMHTGCWFKTQGLLENLLEAMDA